MLRHCGQRRERVVETHPDVRSVWIKQKSGVVIVVEKG